MINLDLESLNEEDVYNLEQMLFDIEEVSAAQSE